MKRVKEISVTVGALLASWLGILYVPMLILIACNIIDYITGLCAAKYRSEAISSYKSFRGIAKKICMWLLVAIGAMLDWLLSYAVGTAGISIGLNFVVASVAAVWLIANEIISILENIRDIGTPLPPFLMKIAENVKKSAENKGDDDDEH
ncbi:Phage-related holin (Lysis protein) [uncultured Ruminococcus sp.]|jgi:toxin secretion/phage lysis holin|uniref:phage holin family protein n=1 Tax=Huintestinicola butyrica TaxID=2981728 RepID=UPI0008234558|nr:phage holin family protein [Huintestinicola butyrica]MCU6728008.1 phage holin family protein [Huintestinicola butyrica]SCI99876.1 Phage-related holin (Lysis protein) [uncultured Ruminococcus sp.]